MQPLVPMEMNPGWNIAGLNFNNFFKKIRRWKDIFVTSLMLRDNVWK